MRLRSQKVTTTHSEKPRRSSRSTSKAKSGRTRLSAAKSPGHDELAETVENSSCYFNDDIPTMARQPRLRTQARMKAVAVDDSEMAFKTPSKSMLCHSKVLSEIDQKTPPNATARNIYSPIVRFFTPTKENMKCPHPGSTVLMSPEHGVFGYSSIDLLVGQDDNDVFCPFNFMKSIPPHSKHCQTRFRDIAPKTRSTPEATLVVDLEETLMFSSLNVIEDAEYTFNTKFQDHQYKVYVVLRPHVKEFLLSVSRAYELFVYTCAKKEYAEKILDILDPQRKLFRHRLYQEDCVCLLGHYIKDLSVISRDLAKTVVLDNSPHTYPYHLMNTVPIKGWSGDLDDRELQKLIPYMEKLSAAEDFREVLKKRKDHFHRLLSED
ncbi:CTD small phosphatase-like protein 3 isoform X1 [Synchiropus splendidus]|uniref:CTD small phosphatase-like protein 3 isoform X1 n=2 Tax=Synchiropus splendidus TaxID=270530 RepID=UPI00237D7B93|nr:CTD small phosphatase-like protein 3 isoform X1 [Synchiropus splendidus]